MKAIVYHQYGSPDVLRLEEVDRPAVEADSVLVRVRTASVNAMEWHLIRGEPLPMRLEMGLRRPKSSQLGVDLAGRVEAVGAAVTEFKPGDAVIGHRSGALAEFVCGRERNFVRKPERLTFEQAAAVPAAGLTALQGLRDAGQLRSGQRALINGAGGGVGSFAVQIACALGAQVSAVCGPHNVETARRLGAQRVFDYTKEDFLRSGERYDLIFDVAGSRALLACRRALQPHGRLVIVGGPAGRWLGPLKRWIAGRLLSPFVSQQFVPFLAHGDKADLLALRSMLEAGQITPVIDRTYPLHETAEAVRYLEAGHARGKVVIQVA